MEIESLHKTFVEDGLCTEYPCKKLRYIIPVEAKDHDCEMQFDLEMTFKHLDLYRHLMDVVKGCYVKRMDDIYYIQEY